MLPVAFDPMLASILGHKARSLACVLIVAGCGPDHVHVLLRLAPTIALAGAVQSLKGATAHNVNQERLLTEPLTWQAGYWAESLGPADLDPVARYLRLQRQHHDDSHPTERWQRDPDKDSA
jgi:putative transposase